jgi:hypothetical protein
VEAILFFGSMWFLDSLRLCLLDLLEILGNKKENGHKSQQKRPIYFNFNLTSKHVFLGENIGRKIFRIPSTFHPPGASISLNYLKSLKL